MKMMVTGMMKLARMVRTKRWMTRREWETLPQSLSDRRWRGRGRGGHLLQFPAVHFVLQVPLISTATHSTKMQLHLCQTTIHSNWCAHCATHPLSKRKCSLNSTLLHLYEATSTTAMHSTGPMTCTPNYVSLWCLVHLRKPPIEGGGDACPALYCVYMYEILNQHGFQCNRRRRTNLDSVTTNHAPFISRNPDLCQLRDIRCDRSGGKPGGTPQPPSPNCDFKLLNLNF